MAALAVLLRPASAAPIRRSAAAAAGSGRKKTVKSSILPSVPNRKRAVESSIRFFWTISHAQIYPSLKRLERAHLIKGRSQPLGKRARRVFEVTPAGEAALKDWLRRDDPMPFELRDIGLVKLFFADALDRGDAAVLVAAIKRRSEARNVTLASIAPSAQDKQSEGNTYPLLTLRMGIAFHQAIIAVCSEFEQSLLEISPKCLAATGDTQRPSRPTLTSSLLLRSWADQCPQRHQGPDGNVLGIPQLFLGERQRFHNVSRLVLGLRVDQEDDSLAVAARIPLADFPVEVEFHGCPNLCRHNGHELLKGHALLGSLNDQHFRGFRYSYARYA